MLLKFIRERSIFSEEELTQVLTTVNLLNSTVKQVF